MEGMPKQEELSGKENFETIFLDVKEIEKFDTDGFDEYDVDGFEEKINKKGVKPDFVLDKYLEYIALDNKQEDFSLKEMSFHGAMRAWLHCDYKNAINFVKSNFDFKSSEDIDFVKKYKFLNLVSVFIFENMYADQKKESNSLIIQEEISVFHELKKSIDKKESSFLLDYFAKDFSSVADGSRESVTGGKLEYVPFEIAPKIFALDKMSPFVLISKHNLTQDCLYTSKPEDYEKIKEIITNVTEKDFPSQEVFDILIKYFTTIVIENKNNQSIDMQIYRKLNQPYHRQKLKELTSIEINSLSIDEQFYFLNYLKLVSNFNLKKVVDFNNKFSIKGFRTFLSIEHGGKEMGDKILELGEKLPEETAIKVFEKYNQIIDNINNIIEFTQKSFKKEIETSPELISKIEETLYLKAKQVLDNVHTNITKNKEVNVNQIEKSLDRINADTLTTFAIFKQAIKNGEKLPIESIEGAVFSKKEATNISEQQQKEMLDLYEINWKNHPDRGFVDSLKEYFQTAFSPESNQNKNQFYTFEKDGSIRAFLRFEEQEKGNLYASALNVDEASKSFGLGEAMMDEALTREAQTHILHASCRKDNQSNMRYFEKGFIANGFKQTNNTEELDLIWDEKENKNIFTKQKTVQELVEMYLKNDTPENIEIRKENNLEDLHQKIPEGKSLVRCFPDPLNSGSWYAVYEEVSSNYGMNRGATE